MKEEARLVSHYEYSKVRVTLPKSRISVGGLRTAITELYNDVHKKKPLKRGIQIEFLDDGDIAFSKRYKGYALFILREIYPKVSLKSTAKATEDGEVEFCHQKCLDAWIDECVCRCDGNHHQGGYLGDGWEIHGEGVCIRKTEGEEYEIENEYSTTSEGLVPELPDSYYLSKTIGGKWTEEYSRWYDAEVARIMSEPQEEEVLA